MGKKIVLFIFICCLTYNVIATEPSEVAVSRAELQRFATVISDIKKHYVRPVSDEELFDNAIKGVVSGLDPYSAYFKGDKLKRVKMLMQGGTVEGIGVDLAPDNGWLKVTAIIDDTPAKKAGMEEGDVITKINDKPIKDLPLNKLSDLLIGSKGSKITLTILPKNQHEPQTLTLIRDSIKIQMVKWGMLAPNYGYIRIALFQEQTSDDIEKAAAALTKAAKGGLYGVVIDLRNDPGGLFESAVQVANCFLDAGELKDNKLLVYTKGRNSERDVAAYATYGSFLPKVPIVVLINGGTASSAEIVAAALQDHKRAIIAGTHSFGKGLVQTVFYLDKESAIKITTALYYTPLGRSIQGKGVIPDVIINDTEIPENNQMLKPIGGEYLAAHTQNSNNSEITRQIYKILQSRQNDELALAYKDYQLYEALHILEGMNYGRYKLRGK